MSRSSLGDWTEVVTRQEQKDQVSDPPLRGSQGPTYLPDQGEAMQFMNSEAYTLVISWIAQDPAKELHSLLSHRAFLDSLCTLGTAV